MAFQPKKLSYDDLRAEAEEFLRKYHAEGTLPVPIEEIAEFDFEIELIPMDGLKDDLGIDAFLTSDAQHIYIDAYAYAQGSRRMRFSLAHELAHFWLHDLLYQHNDITSVADYRRLQEEIGEDYWWFEWQANALAGLILVPTYELQRYWDEALAAARDQGLSDDILFSEVGKPFVLQHLSEVFEVSEESVEIRLHKDDLWRFPPPPSSARLER